MILNRRHLHHQNLEDHHRHHHPAHRRHLALHHLQGADQVNIEFDFKIFAQI